MKLNRRAFLASLLAGTALAGVPAGATASLAERSPEGLWEEVVRATLERRRQDLVSYMARPVPLLEARALLSCERGYFRQI